MFLSTNLKKLLIIGFLVEALIFVCCYLMTDNWGEIFRLSARYSGRLSLIIYLICFFHFTFSFIKKKSSEKLKNSLIVFCFLHYIHFIFLALSVYLNDLPIIPLKLTGGFIAYLMILIYPLMINMIKKMIYHFIFYYYVGIVFAATYLSRIQGNFEGANPETFHFIGLGSIVASFILFTILIMRFQEK
ncbi:hypothetical protein OAP92_03865 [Flavobacteriaceae bacterium]|jgi:hypothetical protein|nr:hypothetical protein [Cryomorphaceae bacterium]MDC1010366.1 hypothetical protein [Flavobacteriaceae bacterium]|tara:strand:- start:301 stop:864 length:564 start_codon:yes stop_codon:yes gene_type:complete